MNELALPTLYGAMFLALLFFIKRELKDIDDHMKNMQIHQTEREREAMALLVHAQLEAHEKEDFLRFKAIDDRMALLAGIMEDKLDKILTAVTGGGNGKKT